MDGLEDRGSIVVIGATNRPDSIDPALRRPGRFDRELRFDLPPKEARKTILEIHTKEWKKRPNDEILNLLAEKTAGFCGADLQSLCSEAALASVKLTFPQIYASDVRLKINVEKLEIEMTHFERALTVIKPASERSSSSLASPLDPNLEILLSGALADLKSIFRGKFQRFFHSPSSKGALLPGLSLTDDGSVLQLDTRPLLPVFRPKILISGKSGNGHLALAKAFLHSIEDIRIISIALPELFKSANGSPEEILSNAFAESKNGNLNTALFMGNVASWFECTTDVQQSLLLALLANLPYSTPVLLLGYLETNSAELDDSVKLLFESESVFSLPLIKSGARKKLLDLAVFGNRESEHKIGVFSRKLPVLPIAEMPLKVAHDSGDFNSVKSDEKDEEEMSVIEWKQTLREITNHILDNKRFRPFHHPVDIEIYPGK